MPIQFKKRTVFFAALGALGAAWGYTRRLANRWEDLDLADLEKRGKTVCVDGVDIHYEEQGSGHALLMLHGLGASTFAFRLLQPLLASNLRTIAIDQQGFGCSAAPVDGDYSLSAQARLLVGLMDRLGIDRAAVLGHSLGGAIAMHAAIAYPERIERLILISSTSDIEARRGTFAARLGRPFLPLVAPFTLHSVRFRRMSWRSAVYDPAFITPELVEQYLRPWHVRGRLRVIGNLLADRRRDPKLDPSVIPQPTLIIWGEADRWLPPSRGQRLERLIPDARLVIIPRAGHLVPEEQPEEVAKAIMAFVESRPAGRAV